MSIACRDNFSTLESYLRPTVSAFEGCRASPSTALLTGCISKGGGGRDEEEEEHPCSFDTLKRISHIFEK